MLDTVPYIIQNNFPDKSFTEIYAPFIASGITAFITLIVLIFTLRSNRKRIREDNLMKIRKEWIQDFSQISSEVFGIMSKQTNIRLFSKIKENEIDEHNDSIFKLNYQLNLLKLKVRVDGEQLTEIISCLESFINALSYKFFLQCSEEQKTNEELEKIYELFQIIKESDVLFNKYSVVIVQEEIKKIKQ